VLFRGFQPGTLNPEPLNLGLFEKENIALCNALSKAGISGSLKTMKGNLDKKSDKGNGGRQF